MTEAVQLKRAKVLCWSCKRTFEVRWNMRDLGTRFSVPVACPHCGATHDDVVIGAEAPPRVLKLDE